MTNLKKKEQFELSKQIIDRALSKGEYISNLQMYEILETHFNLLNESGSCCSDIQKKLQRQYDLNTCYKAIVSESLRWIKREIINQGNDINDILEQKKLGRRWEYKYKNPGYSIFYNNKKDSPFRNIDFALSSFKTRIEKGEYKYKHKDRAIDSILTISESFQKRIDKLEKLKIDFIWELFTTELEDVSDVSDINLKILLDEALIVFNNSRSVECYISILSIVMLCPSYSIRERIKYGKEFIIKKDKLDFINLSYFDEQDFKLMIGVVYNLLPILYGTKSYKRYDIALQYAYKGIELISTWENFQNDEEISHLYSYLNGTLSRLLFLSKEHDVVISHGEKFIDFLEEYNIDEKIIKSEILKKLSVSYTFGVGNNKKDLHKAEKYILNAIEILKLQDETYEEDMIEINKLLSDYYEHLSDIYEYSSMISILYKNKLFKFNKKKISQENINRIRIIAKEFLNKSKSQQ